MIPTNIITNSQRVDPFKHTTPSLDGITGTFHDTTGRKYLANGRPVNNETDAYWASQPAAVQELYYLHSEAERDTLAHILADNNYIIDVPIMVWGWDPLFVMVLRNRQGYKWVPSAKMTPITGTPGIPVTTPLYDPDTIPYNGIPVTIKWAEGYTSPWLQGQDIPIF